MDAFLHLLRCPERDLPRKWAEALHGVMAPGAEAWMARSPGRLDVIGGISDYSGGLVLQMPIAEATFAACQLRRPAQTGTPTLTAVSLRGSLPSAPAVHAGEDGHTARRFEHSLAPLFEGEGAARATLSGAGWGAYVAGAVAEVVAEAGRRGEGLSAETLAADLAIVVWSEVPEGRGVASSAAPEVATVGAVAGVLGVALEPMRWAVLAYFVETRIVGVACGIMDQVAVCMGKEGHVLAILCQEDEGDAGAQVMGHLPVVRPTILVGIDTGVTHNVGGTEFRRARIGAFMSRAILRAAGFPATHLANVGASALDACDLPERLSGSDFTSRYGPLDDDATRDGVEAHETYPVLAGARHAVLEPERARAFQAALQGGPEKAGALGDVLSECHASYGALGLGCEGADVLAELVKEAPGSDGGPGVLVGCRITGGGCGGTVCVAACGDEADVVAGLAWLADEYLCRTGIQARVLRGTSPGAAQTGIVHINAL